MKNKFKLLNQKFGSLKPMKDNVVLGAGLVALDVIVNGSPDTPAKLCAGGSCGNVLSILSFLGWESKPIARLSDNSASETLFNDFTQFDVNTSLLSKSSDGSTPIIIHRILKDKDGNPKHKFEFRVPGTGAWLPQYKPVLKLAVQAIIDLQPTAKVFYFDRISPSTLDLVRYYKSQGALIVFEPSSLKEDKLFVELISLANIVKFSNDRIPEYGDVYTSPKANLEIETLGKKGLRYRLKSSENNEWINIPPFKINQLLDSAGAGDWCTAGIINQLGYDGVKSFNGSSNKEINNALNIGQALGALNCLFFGARGMMYNLDRDQIEKYINQLIDDNSLVMKDVCQYKNMVSIDNFRFDMIL
ncbi:MAG: hypothetical protein RI922_1000 [Bacteroidota bacterium]|jgi:fructokinase